MLKYYIKLKKLMLIVGLEVLSVLTFFKEHSIFSLRIAARGIFNNHSYSNAVIQSTIKQIHSTGFEILIITTITALMLGMTLVGIIANVLYFIGANANIGDLLTITIVRITAPFISGILIILRTSTSLVVDVGKMKENNEIYALKVMGIDPYVYIYFPRVLANIISVVVLSIYFSTIGIIGGYLLLSFQLDSSLEYVLTQMMYSISTSDIATFFFKTILIGFTSASIPLYIVHKPNKKRFSISDAMKTSMLGIFFTFIIIIILGEFLL